MNITGIIVSIGETKQVSEKFSKREFVLKTDESSLYPNFIQLELQQDKCDIIDAYEVDQEVVVDFNLKGRQWTDQQGVVKTFNTLVAWKIQPTDF